MEYINSATDDDECIFCKFLADDDDHASHILYRGATSFVILNAFPYNSGHLLIAPRRHAGDLHELGPDDRAELIEMTSAAVDILSEALGAHGFNIGMNLGRVAGAGIPGHLHVHVVPRWGGDTNFMPVVGDTKVLPEMIEETDSKLRPLFARLKN